MWWRRTVLLVGLFIIGIGTCLWFKNPDSHLLPAIFGVVGLVVSFLPLPIAFLSAGSKPSQMPHKKWTAELRSLCKCRPNRSRSQTTRK